jgi:hypothetical protein
MDKHEWAIQHTPAAATLATITRAANASGCHVARSITCTVAAVGTASGIVDFLLLDGVTAVWSGKISVPIGGSGNITLNCNILGTLNSVMTLISTAGGAASEATVALTGYDTYQATA